MSSVKTGINLDSDDVAASDKTACSNQFEGEVVRVSGNTLVTKCSQGNEHTYQLDSDADLSCDGTDCEVADIKVGSKVRVTTKQNDQKAATCVECLDQHEGFGG